MNKSETIASLAKALSAFQGEIKPVPKDSVNPFFKSKYADLSSIISHIQPTLKKNGLSVSQLCNEADGKVSVTTILMHDSGEWVSGTITMTPAKNDPQTYLSTITYSRRGSLSAILGLATEDDTDGEVASGKTPTQAPPTPKVAEKAKVEPKTPVKSAEKSDKKPVEAVKTDDAYSEYGQEIKTALNLSHLREIWTAVGVSHKKGEITDVQYAELTKSKDAKKEELK